MQRFFIAVLVAGLFPLPASGNSLIPLTEVMKSGPDVTYPLVRCAALFQASTEWSGKQRVGADFIASIDQTIKNFLSIAVVGRMQKGMGDSDHVTKVTLRDTRNIANLYLERFESNYARTGHAWSSDPLWISDLQECKNLAELMRDK